jgi:single-stranded DNA-binding protein
MDTSYESNNLLMIKGKIVQKPQFSHSVLGEGFFETKVQVNRLSTEVDILPVTISERLLGDLSEGDEIAIKGQFRSYNKVDNGKSKLMLTAFAREVVDPSELTATNNIEMTGYICKEPVYRTTPFGREIADVLLAVNRAYNKSDYLPCIAWGRNARFAKDLQVGSRVQIKGRVQSRTYQKKDGENVIEKTAYEISVASISKIEEDAEDLSKYGLHLTEKYDDYAQTETATTSQELLGQVRASQQ